MRRWEGGGVRGDGERGSESTGIEKSRLKEKEKGLTGEGGLALIDLVKKKGFVFKIRGRGNGDTHLASEYEIGRKLS